MTFRRELYGLLEVGNYFLKVDRLAKMLVTSFQGAAEVAEMGRFVGVISSGDESYSFPVP